MNRTYGLNGKKKKMQITRSIWFSIKVIVGVHMKELIIGYLNDI